MTTETDCEVLWLQAKECRGLPADHQETQRSKKVFSLQGDGGGGGGRGVRNYNLPDPSFLTSRLQN